MRQQRRAAEAIDRCACRAVDDVEVVVLGTLERLGKMTGRTGHLGRLADGAAAMDGARAEVGGMAPVAGDGCAVPAAGSAGSDEPQAAVPGSDVPSGVPAGPGPVAAAAGQTPPSPGAGPAGPAASGPDAAETIDGEAPAGAGGSVRPRASHPIEGDSQPWIANRPAAFAHLTARQWIAIERRANADWSLDGRREQQPPAGDWRTWLVMGGRGSGKTRAGAEWVQAIASASPVPLRVALIAETLADAREVMVDGVSGLWRIARFCRPSLEISRRRLVWPNGSVAQLFSSEDPESLRGPQFDLAWCDELGKWKHAQETWDMLQFGLRLGTAPRQVVTTTPRAIPLVKAILSDAETVTTRLSTSANAANLAPGFIKAMQARYGGTRLGRQELDGELIEDREDALWNRGMLERCRSRNPGPLGRIVVAVDPPAAERAKDSCCGIVVAGLEASGRAAVLADLSLAHASPGDWGAAVVRAYRRFQADRVVAEINQGGDMVAAILRSIDAGLPVTTVRAMRGKYLRAEPVAALYEQGRVIHAGTFPALEDQMCEFEKSVVTICYSSSSVGEFCKVLQTSSSSDFL